MASDVYQGCGALCAVGTFGGVWIYSLFAWGFLLGLGFGWAPALVAGVIAYFVGPVVVVLGAGVGLLFWLS